jgi:hypothetical protein
MCVEVPDALANSLTLEKLQIESTLGISIFNNCDVSFPSKWTVDEPKDRD